MRSTGHYCVPSGLCGDHQPLGYHRCRSTWFRIANRGFVLLAGHSVSSGGGNYRRPIVGSEAELDAMHGILRTWLAATFVMLGAAVVFYTCGWWLTLFFNGGQADEVTALAHALVENRTVRRAVAHGDHGAHRRLTGSRRYGRVPLIITFVGLIGVRIPLAAWLAWDSIPLGFFGWVLPGWALGVQGVDRHGDRCDLPFDLGKCGVFSMRVAKNQRYNKRPIQLPHSVFMSLANKVEFDGADPSQPIKTEPRMNTD